MNIRIKTTDYEMPAEVSAYLDERIDALEKLLGTDADVTQCDVEVGRAAGHSQSGEFWFAEITIAPPGHDVVRALAQASNVNAAIDEAKDEAMRQLRKRKRQNMALVRRGGAALKRMLRFGRED